MNWDDFRRLFAGTTLFRLDSIIAVRLVPIFYALGLAATGLWAIDHLFASFEFNFGQGLWGILEILVYGSLTVAALRIISEIVLVYFKANEAAAATVDRSRRTTSLLEDIGDAIHDLAEDDITPPAGPLTMGAPELDPLVKSPIRRTARRTPPAKA